MRTTLLLLLVLAGAARAEYMEPQLQEVPIERLIANVERRVKAAPDDPGGQLELGRLHAMAFSLGAVAQVRSGTLHVYFGPEPRRLPWADEVTPPGKAPQDAAARAHLVEAIRLHREAVRLRPEDLVARLGLGWLLSRSTDAKEAAEAVAHLRQAATAAWEEEEDVESYGKGPSPAREAATYLLQLLDPAKDQAEVADLKRRIATIEGRPRAVTPIALPLDDGCDLAAARAPDARVAFDLDGAGRRGGWSWITPRAGWLVWLPRDGSRRVDSGLQLFGGCTWWVFWSDGYAPLAALDDDGDGALRGRELANLGVWRDEDSDGQSDPGEVRPLAAWGIVALDVRGEAGDGRTTAAWAPRGATLADGRTRPTWDLLLRFSPSGR